MEGAIIVVGIIALVVIVVLYLFRDTGVFKKLNKVPEDMKKKVSREEKKESVRLVNGPTISYRRENEKKYHSVVMDKSVFKIGSNEKNDLVLSDETVEGFHAALYKQYRGSEIYYELINYGKENPTAYYDKKTQKYKYLSKKGGVALEGREAFYIGSVKFIVSIPVTYDPSITERKLSEEDEEMKYEVVLEDEMDNWE